MTETSVAGDTNQDRLKQAVIYLRVSTAQQAKKDDDPEGYSIPYQREACRRKAEALGALVVEEFIDAGESAKSADRPALQAMLERIGAAADIDYLIVHKVDRLARSREDDVTISLALKTAGVQLVSVTENIDETPSGKLLHGIMASIAEFYSRNLATEIMKGTVQKAKSGGTPFLAPLGYLNVRKVIEGQELRTIEIDHERAPLIRWAFHAYASGEYSLRYLLDELTAKGLTNRPSPKRPARPLHLSKLAELLRNPYYVGVVVYRGVEYPGKHEPLVDADIFAGVQDVLRAHDVAGDRKRTHDHYLKGTLFCAPCGSRIGFSLASGNGGIYPYFFCYSRHRNEGCDLPYIKADEVEDWVIDNYSTVQLEAERVDALRLELREELASQRQRSAREIKRQETRIARLTNERAKLLRAYYAGAVTLELLKSEQARLNQEIASANRILSARNMRFTQIEEMLLKSIDIAADCRRMYELADDKVRREINQALFKRILVDNNGITRSERSYEFAALLARDSARGGRGNRTDPIFSGVGSIKALLVGERGVEPPRVLPH